MREVVLATRGAPATLSIIRGGTSALKRERENVLLQMEHLKSYDRVTERVEKGQLMLHGLWFDIQNTDVYYASPEERIFRIIDDMEGARILALLREK